MRSTRSARTELAELRDRLREAEETIEVIRLGGVDSVVIGAPGEERVYSLTTVDRTYRLLVDAMHEGAATVSARGVVLYANASLAGMLDRSVSALVGTDVFALTEGADRDLLAGLVDPETTDPAPVDLDLVTQLGERIPVQLSASHFEADGTQMCGLVVTDLRARRKTASELQAALESMARSAEFLRQTERLAHVGGWAYDVESGRLTWTDEVYQIHEVPEDFDPGNPEHAMEFYTPQDRTRIADAFNAALRDGVPYDLELQLVTARGRETWVRTTCHPEVVGGSVARLVGHFQDVTAEHQADEDLRLAHQRLRRIIDSSLIGIVIIGPDRQVLEANDYYLTLTGSTRQDVDRGGIGGRAITPPEWVPATERARAELEERGRTTPFEMEYLRSDGTRVPVLVGATRLPGPDHEVAAFAVDLSDQKRAERERGVAFERLQRFIDANVIGICLTTSSGVVVQANDYFCHLIGYSQEQIAHGELNLRVATAPEYWAATETALAQARAEGTSRPFEKEYLRPDGSRVPVLVADTILPGPDDLVAGIAVDITERVQAEAEIRRLNAELETRVQARTADLEAANRELDSFAYSVSHDLRAPLRAIDGFSTILLSEHAGDLDAEGIRLLGVVVRNVKKMGLLIDDLLAFSRVSRKELDRRPVAMAELARQARAEVLAAVPDRKITIKIGHLCVVAGDAALLRQVWMNLLSNAVKFTKTRELGCVEVDCEHGPAECRFRVHDNGVGFDPLYADRLFTPFSRLHASADFEGTGIGLAIVARIVDRHGGRVWAEGVPDVGATFRFALPMSDRRDQPIEIPEASDATAVGGPVDD